MTDKKHYFLKKKWIYNGLIIAFSLVFVFCIYKILSYYLQLNTTNKIKDDLIEEVVSYEETSQEESSQSAEEETSEPVGYYHAPVPKNINFEALKAKNEEVVGWLFNENGIINYPVMHTDNNQYYLNHLIDRSQNVNGSVYVDFRNKGDFSDYNTIVYAHSMKNGTMFASLLRYRNYSYYSEYPCFYLYTPQGNYRVDIFSAYETDVNDIVYDTIQSTEEFEGLISHAVSRSRYKINTPISVSDTVVTFSTCAYSSDNARFVVLGKLMPIE